MCELVCRVAGLAALKPQLTIVRRGSDGDGDDPDFFLPTVRELAGQFSVAFVTYLVRV